MHDLYFIYVLIFVIKKITNCIIIRSYHYNELYYNNYSYKVEEFFKIENE